MPNTFWTVFSVWVALPSQGTRIDVPIYTLERKGFTLPKTNIAHENQSLEDEMSFWDSLCSWGHMLSFIGSVKKRKKQQVQNKQISKKSPNFSLNIFEFRKKNISFALHGNCWSKGKAVNLLEVYIYISRTFGCLYLHL